MISFVAAQQLPHDILTKSKPMRRTIICEANIDILLQVHEWHEREQFLLHCPQKVNFVKFCATFAFVKEPFIVGQIISSLGYCKNFSANIFEYRLCLQPRSARRTQSSFDHNGVIFRLPEFRKHRIPLAYQQEADAQISRD